MANRPTKHNRKIINTTEIMRNSKSMLGIMAMMAMMSEPNFGKNSTPREYSTKKEKPKKQIIPKGCKQYHFRKSGIFETTENMWDDIEYIFSCYASNDKNAIKKFNKFNQK